MIMINNELEYNIAQEVHIIFELLYLIITNLQYKKCLKEGEILKEYDKRGYNLQVIGYFYTLLIIFNFCYFVCLFVFTTIGFKIC